MILKAKPRQRRSLHSKRRNPRLERLVADTTHDEYARRAGDEDGAKVQADHEALAPNAVGSVTHEWVAAGFEVERETRWVVEDSVAEARTAKKRSRKVSSPMIVPTKVPVKPEVALPLPSDPNEMVRLRVNREHIAELPTEAQVDSEHGARKAGARLRDAFEACRAIDAKAESAAIGGRRG